MYTYHTFRDCPCGDDSADHDDVRICYACNPSRAEKALQAADELAKAVETFMNWRDPFNYDGVERAHKAVPETLAAYRKARNL